MKFFLKIFKIPVEFELGFYSFIKSDILGKISDKLAKASISRNLMVTY